MTVILAPWARFSPMWTSVPRGRGAQFPLFLSFHLLPDFFGAASLLFLLNPLFLRCPGRFCLYALFRPQSGLPYNAEEFIQGRVPVHLPFPELPRKDDERAVFRNPVTTKT